jgi:spermidine synthase
MAVFRESEGDISRDYLFAPGSSLHFSTDKAQVDIVRTQRFDTMVFLDGQLQLSSKDEYIYHEMLVHPALSCHPNPRRVCILGGGDGCAAREVLKWQQVERCDILDWDSEFVSCFLHHYGHWNEHSLESERVRIENVDIRSCGHQNRQYDVIIVDLLDPDDSGESLNMWSDICLIVRSWLSPQGVAVFNAGGITPWKTKTTERCIQQFQTELKFPNPYECLAYKAFVPSFSEEWCFLLVKPPNCLLSPNSAPTRLSYFDETAWQKSRIWTRDYRGKISAAPVNLTLQAHL